MGQLPRLPSAVLPAPPPVATGQRVPASPCRTVTDGRAVWAPAAVGVLRNRKGPTSRGMPSTAGIRAPSGAPTGRQGFPVQTVLERRQGLPGNATGTPMRSGQGGGGPADSAAALTYRAVRGPGGPDGPGWPLQPRQEMGGVNRGREIAMKGSRSLIRDSVSPDLVSIYLCHESAERYCTALLDERRHGFNLKMGEKKAAR